MTADELYTAWHEALGHREYRLSFTMEGYGRDVSAAEALLEGLLEKHPTTGPVVSQDGETDAITATFSFRAKDPDHAVNLGWMVFTDGGAASGLQPTTIRRIEVEPAEAVAATDTQPDLTVLT